MNFSKFNGEIDRAVREYVTFGQNGGQNECQQEILLAAAE